MLQQQYRQAKGQDFSAKFEVELMGRNLGWRPLPLPSSSKSGIAFVMGTCAPRWHPPGQDSKPLPARLVP